MIIDSIMTIAGLTGKSSQYELHVPTLEIPTQKEVTFHMIWTKVSSCA